MPERFRQSMVEGGKIQPKPPLVTRRRVLYGLGLTALGIGAGGAVALGEKMLPQSITLPNKKEKSTIPTPPVALYINDNDAVIKAKDIATSPNGEVASNLTGEIVSLKVSNINPLEKQGEITIRKNGPTTDTLGITLVNDQRLLLYTALFSVDVIGPDGNKFPGMISEFAGADIRTDRTEDNPKLLDRQLIVIKKSDYNEDKSGREIFGFVGLVASGIDSDGTPVNQFIATRQLAVSQKIS